MAELPLAFSEQMRQLMGVARYERYVSSFDEEPPVSIRLNPRKAAGLTVAGGERVPWCEQGWFLARRPNFTADPLLHGGCYYVQEAASMFLDHVVSEVMDAPHTLTALDLCAAPGGKSTLLRARLPEQCVLYSNEPNRQRASVLAENVAKWGYERHLVTNNYPKDFRKARLLFDFMLCDVPCSGEGMFRKDPATIGEWSPQQVERCSQLQRDIVSDAWACLRPGGVLVYSTCTFNTRENEENIRWLLSEQDAEVLPVSTKPEWNITGSLLDGFTEPVYRFIPGISRSEGLFVCVLRKAGASAPLSPTRTGGGKRGASQPTAGLTVLNVPADNANHPQVDIGYQEAISYLRREALTLPADTPRGLVEVCFQGHPLGMVKNIGTRANNLYPKEWRIKTTHTPDEYESVLTPITQ